MLPVIQLTSLEQLRQLTSGHESVVVLFHKTWCPFCKKMYSVFDSAAGSDAFKTIQFCKVNLEEQEEIAGQMLVPAVPETAIFRDGERLIRLQGDTSQKDFEAWLTRSIDAELTSETGTGHSPQPSAAPIMRITREGSPAVVDDLSLIDPKTVCTGNYQDRRKRPSLFSRHPKPFSDPEPNCVFQPTPEDSGLQIGRANDDVSYFAIILWNSTDDDPGKIFFSIDFMPDPVKKARFESAVFWVTFGHDSKDGPHLPLNILDIFPTHEEDMNSRTFFDSSQATEGHNTDDSSLADSQMENTIHGTRTQVRGQGLRSPTAVWNFTEDETLTVRQGLDAHYTLFVSLPTTSRVWMKFWGKAVLLSGEGSALGLRSKATLKIGSMEAPYERILDLSVALRESSANSQKITH